MQVTGPGPPFIGAATDGCAVWVGFGFGGRAAAEPRPPIFVLNSLDADVSVVDPASFTQIKRIPTGKEPHHLYLTPG